MDDPVTEKMVTSICPRCHNIIDVTRLEPGDSITCPYCHHEFPITRQFGNFLLEKQVGSGGMGTVYLGKDITLNRVIAVKVLKPELVSDHKFMATFLREAEITASLNHPNIVQVYAFGEHEGTYFLVVEYISGGSLDDKIMNYGSITELEGIEIGIAVARGLECALQRGLIHRDIKPGNILFNANNTAKVVDFGLSLSFETTDHFDGEIWGTPYYVAPEKLEREPEGFHSDLYSLGATLFHALSGRPPYEGEDPNDVAMKHLSGSVVSLKAFVPGISNQTADAVAKAMARYPEDRHESYAAFISQLEDAKRRITDPNARVAQDDTVIIQTAGGSNLGMWIVIGMVVIVLLLGGLFLWKGSSLFNKDTQTQPSSDLNDYNPNQPAKPSVVPIKPKSTPAPSPSPVPDSPDKPMIVPRTSAQPDLVSQLVVNGNFSANASRFTTLPGYDAASSVGAGSNPLILNWTDGTGIHGVNGRDTSHFYSFAPSSHAGVKDFAFLQRAGSSLSQVINLTAGQSYTLSYKLAGREHGSKQTGSATVTANGTTLVTLDGVANASSFTAYTTTFTAPATGPAVLSLNNTSAPGDNTVDFTDVSIVPNP